MPQSAFEVADIFRRHGQRYRATHRLLPYQHKLMRAIERCRTAALGGHVEECLRCQHRRIAYNSCRNRHCPKCQNLARAKWLDKRKSELLPVEYFHVVFTIPDSLHDLALQNKRMVYQLLFQTTAETLQTIARDPKHLGARIGFFSILHTWGQNLMFHPHIHSVVTGGGLSPDQSRWIHTKPGFFLSVRVLSHLFRRLFLEALLKSFDGNQLAFHAGLIGLKHRAAFVQFLKPLRNVDWVVYAKPPFGGPQQVLEYLGRYTHRVAISNQRLLDVDEDSVTFQYKDYRQNGRQKNKQMTISGQEFIRRFLLHGIPPGFPRIRHYGIVASSRKKVLLSISRNLLLPGNDFAPSPALLAEVMARILRPIHACPACHAEGSMVVIERLDPASPPFRHEDSS